MNLKDDGYIKPRPPYQWPTKPKEFVKALLEALVWEPEPVIDIQKDEDSKVYVTLRGVIK